MWNYINIMKNIKNYFSNMCGQYVFFKEMLIMVIKQAEEQKKL